MKYCCNLCGWKGFDSDLKEGVHPFLTGETIFGCPSCGEITDLVAACDEPGCWSPITCGTPVENAYHQTCWAHRQEQEIR